MVYFQFEEKIGANVWMDAVLTFEYTTHQNSDILQLLYLQHR